MIEKLNGSEVVGKSYKILGTCGLMFQSLEDNFCMELLGKRSLLGNAWFFCV